MEYDCRLAAVASVEVPLPPTTPFDADGTITGMAIEAG